MSNTDPLAALRQSMASGKQVEKEQDPQAETSKVTPQGPALAEALFQRLRYFENLVEGLFGYQKALRAQVQRTGTAPLDMPHVEPLKNALGDYDPNGR